MSCKHGNSDFSFDPCDECQAEVAMWNSAYQEGRDSLKKELSEKGTVVEAQQAERIKELEGRVIAGFYEFEIPQFKQGMPHHELQDFVTAKEVTGYVEQLSAATASLASMKALLAKMRNFYINHGYISSVIMDESFAAIERHQGGK